MCVKTNLSSNGVASQIVHPRQENSILGIHTFWDPYEGVLVGLLTDCLCTTRRVLEYQVDPIFPTLISGTTNYSVLLHLCGAAYSVHGNLILSIPTYSNDSIIRPGRFKNSHIP